MHSYNDGAFSCTFLATSKLTEPKGALQPPHLPHISSVLLSLWFLVHLPLKLPASPLPGIHCTLCNKTRSPSRVSMVKISEYRDTEECEGGFTFSAVIQHSIACQLANYNHGIKMNFYLFYCPVKYWYFPARIPQTQLVA